MNLISIIPIEDENNSSEIAFFIGFQVDLMEQSSAILRRLEGNY